ncbi:hypothetical protein ACO0QE_001352 [Hanseniaspora vineae]
MPTTDAYNNTSSVDLINSSSNTNQDVQVCVIMVGLPARGKTFIANKIQTYLRWLMINCQVFNVGNYRRELCEAQEENMNGTSAVDGVPKNTSDEALLDGENLDNKFESVIMDKINSASSATTTTSTNNINASFFDFNNEEAMALRNQAYVAAIDDITNWFQKSKKNNVAILDGTSCTRKHRKWILSKLRRLSIEPIFIETFCDDEKLLQSNLLDLRKNSPDANDNMNFQQKIRYYEAIYESLNKFDDEIEYTFAKLIKSSNNIEQVIVNKIQSYLESRIIFFVMNLHYLNPHKIVWLSRHGESIYNIEKKIGGNSLLSERGELYSEKLPSIIQNECNVSDELIVWTSTLARTQQTAQHLPYKTKLTWKALDELDAGLCDGMTYEEIESKYPDDFKQRDEDKYGYRYRGGESYRDVVIRLEPVIMELERQQNILIITHQAVLRCIYSYFMNIPQDQSPWVAIPLHTLIRLEVRPYGPCKVTLFKANIPAVSTYKEKGTSKLGIDNSISDNNYRNLLINQK